MATPSTALSIAAFAAGVTLMLLAHVLVILWALRRGAGADADQERAVAEDDGGGKGLSANELETLPCHDLSSNGADAGECAVCLEAFEAGDRCRRLPRCEHGFHSKCVDPWLKKSRFCPVCRADVVPKEEEVVKGGGEDALVAVDMAAVRRSTAEAEMVVIERLQQYNWSLHTGIVLR
jgi:cbb3-type cytochrome oxidase subunit 3